MVAAAVIKKHGLIFAILTIAGILRFYRFFDLEYTFDELSALSRLEYSSFGELIEKGIRIDGHPAFVQVLLYYYTAVFGTSEYIVKLPFVLMGIASVYIVYAIGTRHFTKTSGLLAAALMSCMQYFVFYSTVARPYSSGLFFSLLALYFWLEIVFSEKASWAKYLWFSLFAAIAALNHHFAMLFCALCGLAGWLFVADKKKYLIACVVACLIYLPHLPVLLYQLNIGGIGTQSGGWLQAPTYDFVLQYLNYLFHFSQFFLLVFLLALAAAKYKRTGEGLHKKQQQLRWVLLALFVSTFLVGFIYSVLVNPVLQYSTLIFCSPCLLLFVTSFAGNNSHARQSLLVTGILLSGIITLVVTRQHYRYIYSQGYDTISKMCLKQEQDKPPGQVFVIAKGEPWFYNFYKKRYQLKTPFMVTDTLSAHAREEWRFDTLQADYLVLGDCYAKEVLKAIKWFPYLVEAKQGYGYQAVVLSKKSMRRKAKELFTEIASTHFPLVPTNFNLRAERIKKDSLGYYYEEDPRVEFGTLSYVKMTNDFNCREGDCILGELTYSLSNRDKQIALCVGVDEKKKIVKWAGSALLSSKPYTAGFNYAGVEMYVDNIFLGKRKEMTFFTWNSKKQKLRIHSLKIYQAGIYKGRYALFQPVNNFN